ncbi:MAG: hypothetical protein LUG47_03300 [Clostridiales bacterium]|nr:hypothetical protein [Clostridiales bacterium]
MTSMTHSGAYGVCRRPRIFCVRRSAETEKLNAHRETECKNFAFVSQQQTPKAAYDDSPGKRENAFPENLMRRDFEDSILKIRLGTSRTFNEKHRFSLKVVSNPDPNGLGFAGAWGQQATNKQRRYIPRHCLLLLCANRSPPFILQILSFVFCKLSFVRLKMPCGVVILYKKSV